MSIQELEQYFANNELPSQIKLNSAITIGNTSNFINTNLARLKIWKGEPENCPNYWHLMELINALQLDHRHH